MNELSNTKNKKIQVPTRESIIGLGEASFKKNYYPALQKKIADLEQLNDRYRTLIKTIPDIFLGCTADGEITNFAPEAGNDEGLVLAILKNESVLEELKNAIAFARRARVFIPYNFVFPYYNKIYYFEARINITETEEALIIIRDVTERILIETELRDIAEKDSLTNLHNRRYFEEKLSGYDGRVGENFSILLIDIDGLKVINDTLGHTVGDHVLMTISRILNENFGSFGHVARVGGDEFGVILLGYPREQIQYLLENVFEKIEQYNETEENFSTSVSYGYAHMESGTIQAQSMYQEADDKMYQNKILKESSSQNNFVRNLMKTLENKDYMKEGHIARVEELSEKLGRALNLSPNQLARLALLARFHDIGKVGVPDSILFKTDKLTEEEWIIIKAHSSIGMRIAESSLELRDIADLIYHHHEKWDGTGYPAGLEGTAIPIECRVLAIADAFDAMTNDRPYRKALSAEAAMRQLIDCSGIQFDENLVHVFLDSYAVGSEQVPDWDPEETEEKR